MIIGGSFGAGNYAMCGRSYGPRFLWMWPNARISVMGGEQAASVLATVRRDNLEARGEMEQGGRRNAFKAPIRAQYETEGIPIRERTAVGRRGIRSGRYAAHSAAWRFPQASARDPAYGVRRVPEVMFKQILIAIAARSPAGSSARRKARR